VDQTDEYNLGQWFRKIAELCEQGDFDIALGEATNAMDALKQVNEERGYYDP
jgi:hypothetical protein